MPEEEREEEKQEKIMRFNWDTAQHYYCGTALFFSHRRLKDHFGKRGENP